MSKGPATAAFSLSQAFDVTNNVAKPKESQFETSNCNNDYMIIDGGFNPAVATNVVTNSLDRYCGEQLNPLLKSGGTSSVAVCCKFFLK